MKTIAYLLLLLGLAGGVAPALAQTMAMNVSYDGSYVPSSATPPSGQSTWAVAATGGAQTTITPNSPSAGLATFSDTSTSGRTAINFAFTAGATPFSADQSNDAYTFSFRMKLNSTGIVQGVGSAVFSFGLQDEYNGSTDGRAVNLGFVTDLGTVSGHSGVAGIEWATSTNSVAATTSAQVVSTVNPFDDAFHTYTVNKYLSAGVMNVSVSIDGTQVWNGLYSSLSAATTSTTGLTISGSSPGTAAMTLDYITLSAAPEAPVWGTMLLGLGLIAFRLRRRACPA